MSDPEFCKSCGWRSIVEAVPNSQSRKFADREPQEITDLLDEEGYRYSFSVPMEGSGAAMTKLAETGEHFGEFTTYGIAPDEIAFVFKDQNDAMRARLFCQ